jgi:hypothetical protein
LAIWPTINSRAGERVQQEKKLGYEYISAKNIKKLVSCPKQPMAVIFKILKSTKENQINSSTHFIVNGNDLIIEKDFSLVVFSEW